MADYKNILQGERSQQDLPKKEWTPQERLDFLKAKEDKNFGGNSGYDPLLGLWSTMAAHGNPITGPLINLIQRLGSARKAANLQKGIPAIFPPPEGMPQGMQIGSGQASPQQGPQQLPPQLQQILQQLLSGQQGQNSQGPVGQ